MGSPLMMCQQIIAIDLPQKTLIWEDTKGVVYLSNNDPMYLQKRYNATGGDEVLAKTGKAVEGVTSLALSFFW